MNVTIHEIEEDDFQGLVNLFQEFAHFEKLPEKMTNTVEKMKTEKAHINGFVARGEQSEIIAYVTFFFTYYTWTGKSMYMDDLYVREEFRNRGIGKRLLEKVIDFAKIEQCSKLRWQVSNWNTNAQDFYKSMGAEIDDVELNCDLML
jgi:GNAT superfamily N-acetyltransferase